MHIMMAEACQNELKAHRTTARYTCALPLSTVACLRDSGRRISPVEKRAKKVVNVSMIPMHRYYPLFE